MPSYAVTLDDHNTVGEPTGDLEAAARLAVAMQVRWPALNVRIARTTSDGVYDPQWAAANELVVEMVARGEDPRRYELERRPASPMARRAGQASSASA